MVEQQDIQIPIHRQVRSGRTYARLPRLPVEIIMMIISHVEELLEDYVNTNIETNSEGLKVYNTSLLPQVILKPSVLRHHYLQAIPTDLPLEDIGEIPLKPTILTDKRISKFLKLSIALEIELFDLTRESNDMNILCILAEQVFQRWESLFFKLCESASEKIVPLLDICKPCLPFITDLNAIGYCTVENPSVSSALETTKALKPCPMSLKSVDVWLCFLPTLFNIGVLGGITTLAIHCDKMHLQNIVMPNLPEILSSISRLEVFTFEGFRTIGRFDFSNLPKVRSKTLHTIELNDSTGPSNDFIAFLAIFSECPVRTLDSDHCDPTLEELNELFPHLRKLIYVSEGCAFPREPVAILTLTIIRVVLVPRYGSISRQKGGWKVHFSRVRGCDVLGLCIRRSVLPRTRVSTRGPRTHSQYRTLPLVYSRSCLLQACLR